MLIDNLKTQNLQALKDKDTQKRAILSIVIAEYQKRQIEISPQTLTDADLIQIIQKSIKELHETKANYALVSNQSRMEECQCRIDILSKFLPKMLSEEEIINIINQLDDKSIKSVMMHFRTNFPGQCDLSLVSTIARKIGA